MEQSKQAKERLEAVKSKGGKEWTKALQEELDNTVLSIVDLEEAIEERKNQEATEKGKTSEKKYTPKKGTEKLLHLSLVRGRRFNPRTGKEETKPYIQFFTYGEWLVFKQNYKLLGYTILAVLHDPFGGVQADNL